MRFSTPRSTISTLSEIVAAVDDQLEVWLDSGARSGQDIIRAKGKAGVSKRRQMFHEEDELTMAFIGHRDIHPITRDDIALQRDTSASL